MNEANIKKAGLKQKFVRELMEYWITFLYLAFFFGAFAWYRRLVLAEYQISYLHYGVAVVEALVLAKVILVGDALHLGRRLEERPLIIPTLYKTVVFCVFVGLFGVLEHTIGGLVYGKGLAGGFDELRSEGIYELLAQCLVTFFAFMPFFAFKELGRVLGEGRIRKLFFRNRAATESGFSTGSSPEQAAG
ncbi:MAG: conserved rane protein of unknown function [Pedosphaera sp.]|nr:conserved rane protein of unknown function [Pedosphaera sp.]